MLNDRAIPRRFEGQIALVIRASSLIGAAVASRLGHEGASLFLVDSDADALGALHRALAGEGFAAERRQADVSQRGEPQAILRSCARLLGVPDVLIYLAQLPHWTSILDQQKAAYLHTYEVLAKAGFFMIQAAARPMAAATRGAIVICSWTEDPDDRQGRGDTTVAGAAGRAALHTATRLLAVELAPMGIRVNAVSAPAFSPPPLPRDPELAGDILLRRRGLPEKVAAVAAFLASSDASYVTGALVPANGGASSFRGAGQHPGSA